MITATWPCLRVGSSSWSRLFSVRLKRMFLKIMHPVCLQEVDKEDHAAESPGNGVCPGYCGELVNKLHRHRHIGRPDHAPANQHGKHGDRGLACAPEYRCNAMGKRQQEIKQTNGTHMLSAKVDGFLGFCKEANSSLFCRQTSSSQKSAHRPPDRQLSTGERTQVSVSNSQIRCKLV